MIHDANFIHFFLTRTASAVVSANVD